MTFLSGKQSKASRQHLFYHQVQVGPLLKKTIYTNSTHQYLIGIEKVYDGQPCKERLIALTNVAK